MADIFKIATKRDRLTLKKFVDDTVHNADGQSAATIKTQFGKIKPSLESAYEQLKAAYYSGVPVVDDATFDAFESLVLTVDKKLYKVGSTANELNKVSLPFPMGSMNKYLDAKSLQRWADKNPGPYVISDKLDGISVGIVGTSNPKAPKLYTRGDGSTGLDISHLAPYLGLPPVKNGVQIRGELIMSVADFKKFAKEFANPRNLVAGAANRKTIHPAFKGKKIKLLAYQIVRPAMKVADQFSRLKSMGFLTAEVYYDPKLTLDVNALTDYLVKRKAKAVYEMDGLIVARNIVPKATSTGSNPDWAFAFKSAVTMQSAQAEVVAVHWNSSRYGALKPRVEIKPVKLAGVTVTYATGHNAKFIKESKIGKGAIISIVRSGDVIPYITGVVKPARKADMPPTGSYEWDESAVNILHVEETDQQLAKSIAYFFATLEVEGFKQAAWEKVIGAGYDSVPLIIRAAHKTPVRFKKALAQVDGLGSTTIPKLVKAIVDATTDQSLTAVMVASGAFGHGMGFSLLEPAALCLGDPSALPKTRAARAALKERLVEEGGFGPKRAEQFCTLLPDFMSSLALYTKAGLTYVLPEEPEEQELESEMFAGHRFYITGIRDTKVTEFIERNGGTVEGFNKNLTTDLIYKDGATNTKIDSFTGTKIPYSQFLKKYKL